jgi:hypothetical protein
MKGIRYMDNLTALASLEAQAHAHLQHFQSHALTAVTHWNAFVECLENVQKGALYRLKCASWEEYTRSEFNLSSARLRQIRLAQETSEMLIELTGIAPTNERQVRALNSITAGASDELKAEVWEHAASLTGGNPAPRHIQAAYDVIVERDVTGGYVSFGGESVPATAQSAAILEAIQEADKRRAERIRGDSVSFDCEIGCIDHAGTMFFVLVGNIPVDVVSKSVRVWVKS